MKVTQARIDEVRALRVAGKSFSHIASKIGLSNTRAQQIAKMEFAYDRRSGNTKAKQAQSDNDYHRFALELARRHKIPLRADPEKGVR